MKTYRHTALAAAICTALSAGHAGAATFNVTNTDDSGAGSLRDALLQAGANAEADVIDMSTVSGDTIALSSGQLEIDDDSVTINGAGVTIDAEENSRVLAIYASDVSLNDQTITGGLPAPEPVRGLGSPGAGGGVLAIYSDLDINDSEITGNAGNRGAGLYFYSYTGSLSVNDSVVSGNSAVEEGGGAVAGSKYGDISVSGSEITSNTGGYLAGGIGAFSVGGSFTLLDSTVSGNVATEGTGPGPTGNGWRSEFRSALDQRRDRSPWRARGEGDGEGSAGGVYAYTLYGEVEIIGSTISGNSAGVAGGLLVDGLEGSVLVESSTISDNAATFFGGAGTLAAKYELRVRNSTISGNTSGNLNGGIVVYSNMDDGPQSGQTGSERGTPVRNLLIEFTTITDNSASDVGGLGISSDIAFPVTASVIAGNSAATDPDIGFDPGGLGEAEVAFSLVGVDTTSGTIDFDTASSGLLGQDPLLGPLADNGGATFTHLPAATSPLVDVIAPGTAGCGSTVTTDQRGQVRPRGEGCDPGAVEQGVTGPPPAALAVPVLDRIGLLLMAGLLGLVGLFGFRHRSSNKA